MEKLGRNNEIQQAPEQKEKLNFSLASLNDTQKQIETEARDYTLKEQEKGHNIIQEVDALITHQREENKDLDEKITGELKQETHNQIENEHERFDTYQVLNKYSKILNSIKDNLSQIQKSKDDTNSLSNQTMDSVVGFFGGETVESIYEGNYQNTQEQALRFFIKLSKEIRGRNLTQEETIAFNKIKGQFKEILKSKIDDTSLIDLTKNEILDLPDKVVLGMYGVKGEVIGVLSGLKNVITGTFDLIKFLGKYTFLSKYREETNIQAGLIWEFCKENGIEGMKDKVFSALGQEMDRIGQLPTDKQAEAIGNIAGNVIAILLTMKAGMKISSKLKGATGLTGVGLHATNTIINGPEDYLFRGAGLGINKLSGSIKNNLPDFSILSLNQVLQLDNKTKLLAGEYFLGKELNEIQKQAIIKAHEIGEGGEYTLGELKQKTEILKEAGFDESERRILFEKGVCGKEKISLLENLYNNDDYEFLEKYKDILGEQITIKDIMGEGVNGIVLKHPIKNIVIKIRKPGEFPDNIGYEIKNHTEVRDIIRSGKNAGTIKNNIKVPRIVEIDPGYFKTYYTMEKIDGQTISTKIFRNEHPKLKQMDPKKLDIMTDREIINEMIKYGTSTEDIIKLRNQFEDKYLKNGINKKGSDLNNALEYMKKNGIEHTDLHSGNIMVDKEGNIYIIDFGTVVKK